jgi:hypothetical protein
MNFLLGGQWDTNRSFSILAEFGTGKRQSQMIKLNYRFQAAIAFAGPPTPHPDSIASGVSAGIFLEIT